MKLTASLLLIVTEWAIICRGNIWDSFEHAPDALLDSWSGEANQGSMKGIHHQSTTPTNAYPPAYYSHTSTTHVHNPGRSNSGITNHFMMEDHAMWPATHNRHHIVSSTAEPSIFWPVSLDTDAVYIPGTPLHSFEQTPVDDTFFKGLPTTDDDFPEYLRTIGRAGSEARKTTTDKWVGLATSSNHVMSSITQEKEKLSLLDRIHMHNEERRVHELIFHMNVLKIPESGNPELPSRKKVFQDIWVKREAESRTRPPGVVVRYDELPKLLEDFNKFHQRGGSGRAEQAFPSDLAGKALTSWFASLQTWMDVYHSRLGIDFEAFDKWTVKMLSQAFIKSSKSTKNVMRGHFVSYILLVDTIITILPETSHQQLVNRIQAFRTAVACFERHTQEQIASQQFNLQALKQKLQFLWSYVEYWLSHDLQYRSNAHLWLPAKQGFEGS
ncbi:hypothetical protein PCANC_06004 [Puccinia coronata f. sp. avenae]|uniref:Uncharacterized protein n=1 Tax=Puccinia coronata f. sp. avenae TaxID=200324 RepID=A0A2N5VTW3_9BASI|nr:hypothetical protein PCANC_06004 [Puccinia coronata f. sp. avenae]